MLFTCVPVSFVCRGLATYYITPPGGLLVIRRTSKLAWVENFPSDYASLFPLHPLEFSSGKYI